MQHRSMQKFFINYPLRLLDTFAAKPDSSCISPSIEGNVQHALWSGALVMVMERSIQVQN